MYNYINRVVRATPKNNMKFSQTQLSNIFAFAGLIVMILNQFGVVAEQNMIAFVIGFLISTETD